MPRDHGDDIIALNILSIAHPAGCEPLMMCNAQDVIGTQHSIA
jgi:hypothetical protein